MKSISTNEFYYEIIDETKNGFEKKIEYIIDGLLNEKTREFLKGIKLKIFVPINMKQKIFEYSTEDEIREHNIYGFKTGNGNVSLPKSTTSKDYVISLDKSIFSEYEYFSTIAHEITHIIDFSAYFSKYGNVYILNKNERTNLYYKEFYLWTEFNAKKNGIKRLQLEFDNYGWNIPLIKTTKRAIEDIEKEDYKYNKLYHLMHFFGRISVYDDDDMIIYDNDIFPLDFLENYFNIDIRKLYFILKKIENFDDFEKYKTILKELTR